MITTGDIANILYRDCAVFGITRVPDGETVVGPLTEERIAIHTKEPTQESYWWKSFNEINICVPDLKDKADRVRLDALQAKAYALWHNKTATGVLNGYRYAYTLYTSSQLEESALNCHYVNVRILFKYQNVK